MLSTVKAFLKYAPDLAHLLTDPKFRAFIVEAIPAVKADIAAYQSIEPDIAVTVKAIDDLEVAVKMSGLMSGLPG